MGVIDVVPDWRDFQKPSAESEIDDMGPSPEITAVRFMEDHI
jgi:hypothetical protein